MGKLGEEAFSVLSSNVRRLRRAKEWTQEKLAEQAGCSMTGIQRLEAGERWPRPDTLSMVSRALGVEVYQLFMRGDEVLPTPLRALHVLREALGYRLPSAATQAGESASPPYFRGRAVPVTPPADESGPLAGLDEEEIRLIMAFVDLLRGRRP